MIKNIKSEFINNFDNDLKNHRSMNLSFSKNIRYFFSSINLKIILFVLFFLIIFLNMGFAFNFECLNVSNNNISLNTVFNVIYNTSAQDSNNDFFIKPFYELEYSNISFFNNYEVDSDYFKLPVNYYYYLNDSIYSEKNFCIHKESYKENDEILSFLEKLISYDIYNISEGDYYKDSVINSIAIINFLDLYKWTNNQTYYEIAINLEKNIKNDSYIKINESDNQYYISSYYYPIYSPNDMTRGTFYRSDIQSFLILAYLDLYEVSHNSTYLNKATYVGNSVNSECNFLKDDYECNDPISQQILIESYYDLFLYTENQTYFNFFQNLTQVMYNEMDFTNYPYSFFIADKLCERFDFDCSNQDNQTILDSLDGKEPESFFQIFQKILYYNDKYKFSNDLNDLVDSFNIFQSYNFSKYYDFFDDKVVKYEYGLTQNVLGMALMRIYENYDSSNIIYNFKFNGDIEFKKNISFSFNSFFSNNLTVQYYNIENPNDVYDAKKVSYDSLIYSNYNEYEIDYTNLDIGLVIINITDNFLNRSVSNLSYRFSYGIKKEELKTIIDNYDNNAFVVGPTCNPFSENYSTCKIENNKGSVFEYLIDMQNYFSSDYTSNLLNLYNSNLDYSGYYETCDYLDGDYYCEDLGIFDSDNYYNTNKLERFSGITKGLLKYYSFTNNQSNINEVYRYINNNFVNDCNLKSSFVCKNSTEYNIDVVDVYLDLFKTTANKFYLNISNLGYNQLKINDLSWNISPGIASLGLELNKELDNFYNDSLKESYDEQINYCSNNNCNFSFYYKSIDFLYNYYLQTNDDLSLKKTSSYFLGNDNTNFDCNPVKDNYNCYDAAENYLSYKTIETANYIDYILGDLDVDISLNYTGNLKENYSNVENVTCEFLNNGSVASDVIVFFKMGELSKDSLLSISSKNSSEISKITDTSYFIETYNSNDYVNLTFEINLSKPGINTFECRCQNFSNSLNVNVENFTEILNYTKKDKYFVYNNEDDLDNTSNLVNISNISNIFNNNLFNYTFNLKNNLYYNLENISINLSSKNNISKIEIQNISSLDPLFNYVYDLENKVLNISRIKSGLDFDISYFFNKSDINESDNLIFNITEKYKSFTNFSSLIIPYNESIVFFDNYFNNPHDNNIQYINNNYNNDFIFRNNQNHTIDLLTFYFNYTNILGINSFSVLNNTFTFLYNSNITNVSKEGVCIFDDIYIDKNASIKDESPSNIFINISGDLEYNASKKDYMIYEINSLNLDLNYSLEDSNNDNWLLKINITNKTDNVNIYNSTLNESIQISNPIIDNEIFNNLSNVSIILDILRDYDYYNRTKLDYNDSLRILKNTSNNTIYNFNPIFSNSPDNHTYNNDTIAIFYDYYTNYYSNSYLIIYKNISDVYEEICNQELLNNGINEISCFNDSFTNNYKVELIQKKFNVSLNKNITEFEYNFNLKNKDNFSYVNNTKREINLTFEIIDSDVFYVSNNTIFFNYTSKENSSMIVYFDNNKANNCTFVNKTYVNNCSFDESINSYKNGLNVTFSFLNDTNYSLYDVYINLNKTYNITSNLSLNNFSVIYNYQFDDFVKSNITFHSINVSTFEDEIREFNINSQIDKENMSTTIGPIKAYENFTFRINQYAKEMIDKYSINVSYFLEDDLSKNSKSDKIILNNNFTYNLTEKILKVYDFSPEKKYSNEEFEVNFSLNNLVNRDINAVNVTFDVNSDSFVCENLTNINLTLNKSYNISCKFLSTSNVVLIMFINSSNYNYFKEFDFSLSNKVSSDGSSGGSDSSTSDSTGGSSGGSSSGYIGNQENQTNITINDTNSNISKNYSLEELAIIDELFNYDVFKINSIEFNNISIEINDNAFELISDFNKEIDDFIFIVLFLFITILGFYEFLKNTNIVFLQYNIEGVERLVYNSIEELYVNYTDRPDIFYKRYKTITKKINNIEKKSKSTNEEMIKSSKFKLLKKELVKAEEFINYFNYKNNLKVNYDIKLKKLSDNFNKIQEMIQNYEGNINEKRYLLKEAREKYSSELLHEKIFFKTQVKNYINDLVQNISNKTLKNFFKIEYNKVDKISLRNIEKYINLSNKKYEL